MMKRKISSLDEEESRLSQIIFNKSSDLVNKLKKVKDVILDDDKKPAWIDEDDEETTVRVATNSINKTLYTEKLKQKYETLMGTPNWAKLDGKHKAEYKDNDKILRTVGHIQKEKPTRLPKDFLELKKFSKMNSETGNEGPIISCVEFHPKASVSLVAGQSGVISLFSIGGDVNNKLHSFKLKSWKISTVQFTTDGSEAYISSKLKHNYCIYNLNKAEPKLIQLPRIVKTPKNFQLSPDGKYIATSDGFDEVYILCTASKELLKSLKHNTSIESLTFSHDSKLLYCYGVQGEVTVWDMSTYRSMKKFYDHGCVTASCIHGSTCGKYLATGSGEGIVNIYETSALNVNEPMPAKIMSNLTTKITNLKFNSTSEILSVVSGHYPNAVKLVHIPSYHVFANFPNQSQNLSQVEAVNFSPNSGYMALSNNKNCAYLYRLKYYKNY